jgi:hypothetical protein
MLPTPSLGAHEVLTKTANRQRDRHGHPDVNSWTTPVPLEPTSIQMGRPEVRDHVSERVLALTCPR